MKNLTALAFGVVLTAVAATPVLADGHVTKVQKYLNEEVRAWLSSAELVKTVDQQNLNHLGLTAKDIDTLDQRWRQEKLRGTGDLMRSKLNNELSAFLRGVKAASGGIITEIFIMDNKGLNVAQTDPTGDYMQGDEAKWQKTYLKGGNAVFIDEVEEDGGMNVAQASLTVAHGNGAQVGAVTIGINVDALK